MIITDKSIRSFYNSTFTNQHFYNLRKLSIYIYMDTKYVLNLCMEAAYINNFQKTSACKDNVFFDKGEIHTDVVLRY